MMSAFMREQLRGKPLVAYPGMAEVLARTEAHNANVLDELCWRAVYEGSAMYQASADDSGVIDLTLIDGVWQVPPGHPEYPDRS